MTSANLAKNRPGLVNIIYLVFSIMAVNSGVKCYLLATNGVLPSDLPEALFSFSHVAFFTAAIIALIAITAKKEWSTRFCIIVACIKAVLIFVAAVILFLQSLEVKALLIGYCVRGSLLFYFSYNLHIDQELKEYLGFGYQKSPEVA